MSWVAVAVGTTAAVAGGVSANQTKQRNKGYINQSYVTAKQRLDLKQRQGREESAEALGARGLTSGGDVNGSAIKTAMVGDMMTADGSPHTLGAQQSSDNAVQMGLESKDLEQQRGRADQENNAQYTNSLIGSAISGATTAFGAYGAKLELGAANAGTPAPAESMRGIDNPGNWFGGISGHDPLGAPGSSWNNSGGVNNASPGQSNADFHVG